MPVYQFSPFLFGSRIITWPSESIPNKFLLEWRTSMLCCICTLYRCERRLLCTWKVILPFPGRSYLLQGWAAFDPLHSVSFISVHPWCSQKNSSSLVTKQFLCEHQGFYFCLMKVFNYSDLFSAVTYLRKVLTFLRYVTVEKRYSANSIPSYPCSCRTYLKGFLWSAPTSVKFAPSFLPLRSSREKPAK